MDAMETYLPLAFAFVLSVAMACGVQLLGNAGRRLPVVTLCVFVAVAAGLVVQLSWPPALELFRRDSAAIAAGQLWRLGTALFFQDGGFAGGVFNLVALLLLGALAEQLWSRPRWLMLYFGAGLVTQLLAAWWQPIGAGNSVACFGLAGGLFARALLRRDRCGLHLLGLAGLAAAIALLTLSDIHGIALALGVAIGLLPAIRTEN